MDFVIRTESSRLIGLIDFLNLVHSWAPFLILRVLVFFPPLILTEKYIGRWKSNNKKQKHKLDIWKAMKISAKWWNLLFLRRGISYEFYINTPEWFFIWFPAGRIFLNKIFRMKNSLDTSSQLSEQVYFRCNFRRKRFLQLTYFFYCPVLEARTETRGSSGKLCRVLFKLKSSWCEFTMNPIRLKRGSRQGRFYQSLIKLGCHTQSHVQVLSHPVRVILIVSTSLSIDRELQTSFNAQIKNFSAFLPFPY